MHLFFSTVNLARCSSPYRNEHSWLALLPPRFSQGLIRRFQPVIEERIAGGPEQYQSEKDKYFQEAWSGEPFKNKVRLMPGDMAYPQC